MQEPCDEAVYEVQLGGAATVRTVVKQRLVVYGAGGTFFEIIRRPCSTMAAKPSAWPMCKCRMPNKVEAVNSRIRDSSLLRAFLKQCERQPLSNPGSTTAKLTVCQFLPAYTRPKHSCVAAQEPSPCIDCLPLLGSMYLFCYS